MEICECCGQNILDNTDNYAFTIKANKKVYLTKKKFKEKIKENKEKIKRK